MSSRKQSVIEVPTAYKEAKPSGSQGMPLTQGFSQSLFLKSTGKQREKFYASVFCSVEW